MCIRLLLLKSVLYSSAMRSYTSIHLFFVPKSCGMMEKLRNVVKWKFIANLVNEICAKIKCQLNISDLIIPFVGIVRTQCTILDQFMHGLINFNQARVK